MPNSCIKIFDSLRKPKEDYQERIDILHSAWDTFTKKHCDDWKVSLDIVKYPWCLQQESGNNLCGYYVCEFLMQYLMKTSEEVLEQRVIRSDQIKAIQEALAGFLMNQVISPSDAQHYDRRRISPIHDED